MCLYQEFFVVTFLPIIYWRVHSFEQLVGYDRIIFTFLNSISIPSTSISDSVADSLFHYSTVSYSHK